MNYYTVPAVSDGQGGITAEMPAGVPWTGQYDPGSNTYLVASPHPPTPANCQAVSVLETECQKRGLSVDQVQRWSC